MFGRLVRPILASLCLAFCALAEPGGSLAQERPSGDDPPLSAIEALEAFGKVFGYVSRQVGPSVVHIQARRTASFNGQKYAVQESGSGVIAVLPGSPKPYILTNGHVIEDVTPDRVEIMTLDRRLLTPVRLWTDKRSDVAVIEIEESDLPAARLGDSDQCAVGNWVLAIGSPFDLSGSITLGIISGKGRRALNLPSAGGPVSNQDFIQTDAAINPGNSGGPLVNLRGEVIGLNTAIASQGGGSEGVGFAIPVNLVRRFATQLISAGRVGRAFLGIRFRGNITPSDAQHLGLTRVRGAWVGQVIPRTPAERAELKPWDVIIAFNGEPVEDQDHLTNLVSMTSAGEKVQLALWRDRREVTLSVQLDEFDASSDLLNLPADPTQDYEITRLGLEVRELGEAERRMLGHRPDLHGLLVLEVNPHSPASTVLQRLDVIDQVHRRSTRTVSDLQQALTDFQQSFRQVNGGLSVRVVRPGETGASTIQAVIDF